jgi:serine/threonine/tyrosine protein kinase RAD53
MLMTTSVSIPHSNLRVDGFDNLHSGFMFRLLTGAAVVGLHAEYDVAHQLGQGSFASVHSAVHRATGTLYAIKIINLEKVKPGWKQEVDENGVEKNPFQREIDVMESLTHPNICKLKEVFIEPAILGRSLC